MSEIGGEIIIIFLLIVANGVFAMSEMAMVTARKSRLQDWVKKGNRGAKMALELALVPNRFLAAVQIGITLVGILAGAFAGRSVAVWLADRFAGIPLLGAFHQELGLAVVVVIITYFSLVIGELVPKRLALRHPEAIASYMARPLWLITRVAAPMVYLLNLSTDAVSRLLGQRPADEPPVTEEEIRMLVQRGTEAGVFEESEQDMVEAVLHLGDETARALMTPRTQIAWLDIQDSPDRTREKIIAGGHSRYPVASGSLDKVEGVVLVKDILAHSLHGHTFDLATLMQPPLVCAQNGKPVRSVGDVKKDRPAYRLSGGRIRRCRGSAHAP
jgi:putative hemolysin